MPTIFSHAIFAVAAGKAHAPESLPFRFWLLTALCAVLPDADVVALSFGVRYDSVFGHRGFTHTASSRASETSERTVVEVRDGELPVATPPPGVSNGGGMTSRAVMSSQN